MTTTAKPKRHWRLFLIAPRSQVRFAAYAALMGLGVASLFFVGMWVTATWLFETADQSIQSRMDAAKASRDLSTCVLSAEAVRRVDDDAFQSSLIARTQSIDKSYENQHAQAIQAKQNLRDHYERMLWQSGLALLGFLTLVFCAAIVLTHRIFGPLFRIRKLLDAIADGELPQQLGRLRESDELKEWFDAFAHMVSELRRRQIDDVNTLEALAHKYPEDAAIRALHEVFRARLKP